MDFRQVVALVATISQADGKEMVIGDGRYAAVKGEKPERAEIAFLIAEPYRGRRVGSRLLRHLTQSVQDAGLSAFEADVLAYDAPMLAVLQRSGCRCVGGARGTLFTSRSLSGPNKDLSLSSRPRAMWGYGRRATTGFGAGGYSLSACDTDGT